MIDSIITIETGSESKGKNTLLKPALSLPDFPVEKYIKSLVS